MALTAFILTTLYLLVSSPTTSSTENVEPTTPATIPLGRPIASTTCTSTGFSPIFSYAHDPDREITFEVFIGGLNQSGPPCNAEITHGPLNTESPLSTGTTISVTELNLGDEIPYYRWHYDTIYTTSQPLYAPTCEGTFANTGGSPLGTHIEYSVPVDIIVSETREQIRREKHFAFTLTCKVLRDVDANTLAQNFVVPIAMIPDTTSVPDVEETFNFPIDFRFYSDSTRSNEEASSFSVEQGSTLYVRLAENPDNSLLKFTTEKCWSTPDSNPLHPSYDVFFEDECPVDGTMQFTDKTDTARNFDFSIETFFFSFERDAAIYFHCDIYICKQDDTHTTCMQNTNAECNRKRRKRRDVGTSGAVETRTLTSKQHVLLSNSEVVVPQCPVNSVYDRESKKCSEDNVLQVNGVYLDIPWNDDLANTSSKVFKDFAQEKEYQLYGLFQFSDDDNNILGIKVVGARQGSVILDVQIVYKATINSSQAFDMFKKTIQDPAPTGRASRIINILKVKRERVIQPVKIARRPASSETDKAILMALVVVLAALFFIAGLVALKLRQERRSRAATIDARLHVKSFENPSLETVS